MIVLCLSLILLTNCTTYTKAPTPNLDGVLEALGYSLAPDYLPEGFEFVKFELTEYDKPTALLAYSSHLAGSHHLFISYPVPFNPEVSPFGWQRPEDAVSIVTVNGETAYLIRGTWSEDTTSNPPLDPGDAEWDYNVYLTLYFDFDLSQEERIGVMIRAVVISSEWITTSEMVKIAELFRQVD